MPKVDKVTGVTVSLIPLAYIVVCAVMFMPGWPPEIRGAVVGSILTKVLPDIVSYYFDSTAREAKKAEEQAKQPMPQVEVPAQTIDAIPPKDA